MKYLGKIEEREDLLNKGFMDDELENTPVSEPLSSPIDSELDPDSANPVTSQAIQLKDRNNPDVNQYPVTLETLVLDSNGTILSSKISSITAQLALKANIQSLDITYDSANMLIILSHGGVTLGTVDCTDFIIQSSLTGAEYSETGAQGEEGQFLKLTFGTGDVVYINLVPIVEGAFDALTDRVAALEEKDVWLTEDEYEALVEAELIDPAKVYHTYEEEI